MSTVYAGRYRIEPNRAAHLDYSAAGSYFITVCTHRRQHLFGYITDGRMHLSQAGIIVEREIARLPTYHPRVTVRRHVVMPNHIHLLITLAPVPVPVEKIHEFSLPPTTPQTPTTKQYRQQRRRMIIPRIIGKLKMITSKYINHIHGTPGLKTWQPSYHDHVVRNIGSFHRIDRYIIRNVEKWSEDRFYR